MSMLTVFAKRFMSRSALLLQEATTVSGVQIKSSCAPGTYLNLNIKKGAKELVALEDKDYPEWLWTVLDRNAQTARLALEPLKMRKKAIRKFNKDKIKQSNFLKQI